MHPVRVTSDYAAFPGDFVQADTTNGPVNISLPPNPSDDTEIHIKLVAGANPVTATPNVDGARLQLPNVGDLARCTAVGGAWTNLEWPPQLPTATSRSLAHAYIFGS